MAEAQTSIPVALQVMGYVVLAAALFGAIAIGIANPQRAKFAIRAGTGLWCLPFMFVLAYRPEWLGSTFMTLPIFFVAVYAISPALGLKGISR